MTYALKDRFRGFLPVVVDVETAGFDPKENALLEIAAIFIQVDEQGQLKPAEEFFQATLPYPGLKLDPQALKFLKIDDPHAQSRQARDEKEALESLMSAIKKRVKAENCTRAILVGHNTHFDLEFLKAACERHKIKIPFHQFSTLDTVSLSALIYGQTVLSKSIEAAQIDWDNKKAHNALYDAQKTAQLFCKIVNQLPFPANLNK